MAFWTADHFRAVTGALWVVRGESAAHPTNLTGISTDSRSLQPGEAFLALRGERFDGHDHLQQTIDAGCSLLIVDREEALSGINTGRCDVLLVHDTLTALTRLATAYRKTLPGRVIAVTGSVGKTTTKGLIHTVLGSRYTGTASPRSFNNHIGVPLTILRARPSDAYLVVEIGTNAPGEIAALARIAQPDIAVVTAIGAVHLEGLGDLDAVLREKASLLSYLREGGVAVVNGDIEKLVEYRKIAPAMVTYGQSASCDLRLTDYRVEADGASFEVNGRWRYRLPLLAEHNALNALAAIAVARHMKLTEPQIAEALAGAAPPPMRLEVRQLGPTDAQVVLINDAYNANPTSMAAALDTLKHHPTPILTPGRDRGPGRERGRRIAVLGDMLELGAGAPDFHRALGQAVVEAEIDRVLFVGPLSLFAAEAVARHWPPSRIDALPAWTDQTPDAVAVMIEPGDIVLIKGSRGVGLERVIPAIEERLESMTASRPSEKNA